MKLEDKIRTNKRITDLIESLAERYRANLAPHKASGESSKFTYDFRIEDNVFTVSFDLVDYWWYIENGRGPGKMPPISAIERNSRVSAIEKWIEVKPIIPDSRTGKTPTTKQLAFLIARSIGEKGTKGTHALDNTIRSSDDIVDALRSELVTSIREWVVEELKNKP